MALEKLLLKESINNPATIKTAPDKNTFLAPKRFIAIPAGTAHTMARIPAIPVKSPHWVKLMVMVFLIAEPSGS